MVVRGARYFGFVLLLTSLLVGFAMAAGEVERLAAPRDREVPAADWEPWAPVARSSEVALLPAGLEGVARWRARRRSAWVGES
jgi:hypothetical protein